LDPKTPVKYHAEYVESLVPTVKFSISFPFFTKWAFECLAWTFHGRKAVGTQAAEPEALFKVRDAIMGALGTAAADISFVAPPKLDDPLTAEVDVYAAPQTLSGAGMWLTESRIKQIGNYMIVKYPELKMCSHAVGDDYETEWKTKPVLPAYVPPLGDWSPATKIEVGADENLETPSVTQVESLGCLSAGVLLGAASVAMWNRGQRQEVALLPAVSE